MDYAAKYSFPKRSNKQKDKSYTKQPTFRKMEVSGKRGQEHGPKSEKDQIERATGLGRRTIEDLIEKWDQTDTALRFQTGGRHQKAPGLLFGGERKEGMYRTESFLLFLSPAKIGLFFPHENCHYVWNYYFFKMALK